MVSVEIVQGALIGVVVGPAHGNALTAEVVVLHRGRRWRNQRGWGFQNEDIIKRHPSAGLLADEFHAHGGGADWFGDDAVDSGPRVAWIGQRDGFLHTDFDTASVEEARLQAPVAGGGFSVQLAEDVAAQLIVLEKIHNPHPIVEYRARIMSQGFLFCS